MKKNAQTHATLLALVGGYVLYIAWHLLDNLRSGTADIAPAAAIAAIVFFTVAGIAVLVYAWRVWRHAPKDGEDSPGDENLSLK